MLSVVKVWWTGCCWRFTTWRASS